MRTSRKIIRAFLASPGDLVAERKAIRRVVDEFNESWADELAYQVELIGWEETVSGYGRPQKIINEDLDRCDLFLGMIWKRWGTPSDINGTYTSGFEEEFQRSALRREETGRPEICMFFKGIDDELKLDPGKDLKKVLDFRRVIIDEKKILFNDFLDLRGIEELVRRAISAYVLRVKSDDETADKSTDTMGTQASKSQPGSKEGTYSTFSPQGVEFLEQLAASVKTSESLETIAAVDVARFRLIAQSVSKSGNDQLNLGNHDLNILFESREKLSLEKRELSCVTRHGMQQLTNENVPLWYWYRRTQKKGKLDIAIVSSFVGHEHERIGAINVMKMQRLLIPRDSHISRKALIDSWFSESSSAGIKAAALAYLANCGEKKDLPIVTKEYNSTDYTTTRSALECILQVQLRSGQIKAALKLVFSSSSVNEALLDRILDRIDVLDKTTILSGLDHNHPKIRLHSLKALHEKKQLEPSIVEPLTGDGSAKVRYEAVKILQCLGKQIPINDVKEILMPKKEKSVNLFGLNTQVGVDNAGEKYFVEYEHSKLSTLPESELLEIVQSSLPYEDAAYFALVDKYFRSHCKKLREHIDDRFDEYYSVQLHRLAAKYVGLAGAADLIEKTKEIGFFYRRILTKRALDLLCRQQKPEDLKRVRESIREGWTERSPEQAKYLKKFGVWDDIQILLGIEEHLVTNDVNLSTELVSAIASISRDKSINDLFNLDISATILKRLVFLIPDARFKSISTDALNRLLLHDSDAVRKATALRAVQSLSIKRIREQLHDYLSNEYRYYNVIHWLDLGASMPRGIAKSVALDAAKGIR